MPLITRFILVFLPLSTVCTISYSYEYVRIPLVIAVQEEGNETIRPLVELTVKRLSQVERRRVPELHYLSLEKLKDQNSLIDADYLIASASVFAALEKYSGLKAVASVRPVISVNPDHAASTAILVDKQSSFKKIPESFRMQMNLLEPRIKDDYILGHTTATYPGWVMAATLEAGKKETLYMEAFLKSLPAVDGLSWAPQADYRQLHQVLTSLDDPFYKSFRKRTWREIVEENLIWFALAGVLIFSWLLHTLFTTALVNKRTRELSEANERRLKAEEHYHNLEKASIVGQMSNIVAHELRQPLAAISNYSLAIRRRLSKGNLDEEALSFAISKLMSESGRASEIIEHVQRYAKGKPSDWKSFSIDELLRSICDNYLDSQQNPLVRYEARGGQEFNGDPLEVELIVRNLIKNAIEAAEQTKSPDILLTLESEKGAFRITVSDNGLEISDDTLLNLREPLKSTKIGGLGLGLSIVKRISEAYEGHVEFAKNIPTGLKVTVWLYSKARKDK